VCAGIREEQEVWAMSTAEQIRATIEPALAPLGLVIEDVTVSPAGKRRVVRVLVDTGIADLDPTDTASAVPPISLDDVADATRAVSDRLDESDVMGRGPYVLEVSSPGIGRALKSRDQFRRQVGRLVEVVHDGGSVTGRLTEVGADRLTVEVPAAKKGAARIEEVELDSVHRGTVQVEFKRPDETGSSAPDAADTDAAAAGSEEDN
jgi:ribosome maturation factor RimP